MLGLSRPLPKVEAGGYIVPLAIAVALAGGAAVAVGPLIAVGASGGLFVTVAMFALGRRSAQAFLGSLAVVLWIYAFMARGGAYIGVAPIYISEVLLFVAALALVINIGRLHVGIIHLVLILFMAWGLARTLPFISLYGIDAFRDAVIWAYALFALAVAATIRAVDFGRLIRWYRWWLPIYVVAMPIVAVAVRLFDAYIPKWPNTPLGGVGIIFFNNGHTGVHLAGVGAFILLGLYGINKRNRFLEPLVWVIWLVGVAIVGSLNRGSLLAASMSGLALGFVRSRSRMMSIALLAPVILSIVAVVNPVLDVGAVRKVSFDQLVENVLSVFGGSSNADLEGTAEWRLAWWQKITDYTINGPYFWDGKGYGINLADDDGFQVNADGSLRAPHNGHIEFLARSGVPGLVLWILLQAVYAIGLLRAAIGAHRAGRYLWVRIFAWLFVYWVAAMVNLSFDPYLEGPHGGIWFWTLFGLGLAAMQLWRTKEAGELEESEAAAVEHDGSTARLAPTSPAGQVRPGAAADAGSRRRSEG